MFEARAKRTIGRAAVAMLLVAAGWSGHALLRRAAPRDRVSRLRAPGFRLVSPLLDVELPEGYDVRRQPHPFKPRIVRLVDEAIAQRRAARVSVYYRDLIDGPWFGIHEDAPYNPASMMKLPVMIAWLKRAERDRRVLGRTFTFDEAEYPGRAQATRPRKTLRQGESYTVEELLRFMLSFSDNRATWLLYRDLRQEEIGDVLDEMDVSNDASSGENQVSAHGYSGFFRILFNASYLGREMSEYALRLLTAEDFPQGIQAGVPRGVTVAAKFGEYLPEGPGGEVQLHEFAIVYHPRGPYILGIMTIGRDWAAQAGVIRDVSSAVYAEVTAQMEEAPGQAGDAGPR